MYYRDISPKRKNRHESGETIVEVLIATAIIGLVLASAFVIVNKNVASNQDVEEHAFAQKLVESQTEQLRQDASTPVSAGCYKEDDIYTTIEDECKLTNGGAVYRKKITKSDGTYAISVTWQTIGGSIATETVYYRK